MEVLKNIKDNPISFGIFLLLIHYIIYFMICFFSKSETIVTIQNTWKNNQQVMFNTTDNRTFVIANVPMTFGGIVAGRSYKLIVCGFESSVFGIYPRVLKVSSL